MNFLVGLTGPRDLCRRIRCLFTGHRYANAMHGYALYCCRNGCGREFLKGYMTTAQWTLEMNALQPIPDELREMDELMDSIDREP